VLEIQKLIGDLYKGFSKQDIKENKIVKNGKFHFCIEGGTNSAKRLSKQVQLDV
jgi:hypothetical protein